MSCVSPVLNLLPLYLLSSLFFVRHLLFTICTPCICTPSAHHASEQWPFYSSCLGWWSGRGAITHKGSCWAIAIVTMSQLSCKRDHLLDFCCPSEPQPREFSSARGKRLEAYTMQLSTKAALLPALCPFMRRGTIKTESVGEPWIQVA